MANRDIIVLCKGDIVDQNTWYIIDEKELENWKKDGSINTGDLIIYPEKILEADLFKELVFKNFALKQNKEPKDDE